MTFGIRYPACMGHWGTPAPERNCDECKHENACKYSLWMLEEEYTRHRVGFSRHRTVRPNMAFKPLELRAKKETSKDEKKQD